jgi:hypothetical protein
LDLSFFFFFLSLRFIFLLFLSLFSYVCTHIDIYIFSFLTSLSSLPKPLTHLFSMNTNLNYK